MPADVLHPSNSEEFNKILAEHPTGFIFVDVYTDWCGPCKRFAPVFQEVQAMYKDKAVFVKLNLEEAREIGAEYKISAIPTLLFFKDGKMIQQIVGAPSKGEYVKVIEKIMENKRTMKPKLFFRHFPLN